MVELHLEDSLAASYKNSAISLLGTYPNEVKTYIHTKTCVLMFTAALFIIAKN